MFEKWRKHHDKGWKCGVLFKDLSKTFNGLYSTNGFSYISVIRISSFSFEKRFRTEINSGYCDSEGLLIGVPQGPDQY